MNVRHASIHTTMLTKYVRVGGGGHCLVIAVTLLVYLYWWGQEQRTN